MTKMPSRAGILSIALAFAAVAAWAGVQQTVFSLPPRITGLSYNFNVEDTAYSELRLAFHGRHEIRIRRVQSASGSVDAQFLDAGPQDVSEYFRRNPIGAGSGGLRITVDNPTESQLDLRVQAHTR